MPKVFLKETGQSNPDVPRALTVRDTEQVSGGLRKIPGLPPTTVYYDDGINILTSDPSKSNVVVNIV